MKVFVVDLFATQAKHFTTNYVESSLYAHKYGTDVQQKNGFITTYEEH